MEHSFSVLIIAFLALQTIYRGDLREGNRAGAADPFFLGTDQFFSQILLRMIIDLV